MTDMEAKAREDADKFIEEVTQPYREFITATRYYGANATSRPGVPTPHPLPHSKGDER